jgi:archaellum component FlaC
MKNEWIDKLIFDEFKDEINERLNAMDERLNAMDERLNAMDEQLNAIDALVFYVNQQVL